MADLAVTPPLSGQALPLALGPAVLAGLPETARFSIAPYRGRATAVAEAIGGLPEPGRWADRASGRILWAGLDLWLVEGEGAVQLAQAAGAAGAAVTDQSDAWAGMMLSGAAAGEVLARLVPVDVEPAVLPAGRVARSLLNHVPCLLVAVEGGFEIRVPRSYARTAVHDLVEAMRSVAARAALEG